MNVEIKNYNDLFLLLLSGRVSLRSQYYVYSAKLLNITLETMCMVCTFMDHVRLCDVDPLWFQANRGSNRLTAGLFLH